MSGTLFILGIGPGDPELITVKAADILSRVKKVFIPVSGQGRESYAYSTASNYISPDTSVAELVFPMTTDHELLSRRYAENYQRIETVLRQGYDAALLTLGDPGTYSSASQIATLLRQRAPDIPIEIIPGITSFAAAAAKAGIALSKSSDLLAVVSSYDDLERIEAILDLSDTVVFLKTYTQRDTIVGLLEKQGLLEKAVYIERVGLPQERIVRDLRMLPDEPDYLSMIIVKKKA